MVGRLKHTGISAYAYGSRVSIEDKIGLLYASSGHSRKAETHQTIIYENDNINELFFIQKGWSFTYRLLPNGSRQIIDFVLPGDIVGCVDIASAKASVSLECLSEVVYLAVPITTIRELMISDLDVGKDLLKKINRANLILIEHLVSIGRRSALARISHLIIEIETRLKEIGVLVDQGFDLPINQTLIADALGLTPIHVNRIFRQMREKNLVVLKSGYIKIHDHATLEKIAFSSS